MDGEDDHGWDGPNIRPPQASTGEAKRPKATVSRKDRQVIVSNRVVDNRPSKSQDQRRHSDAKRRHNEDLRDRLNRNAPSRHRPSDRDEGKRSRRPPDAYSRNSYKDGSSGSRDHSRDEREMRLQRFINAESAKAESRRDMEVRRQRRLLEREAMEAENKVKRKRDRSRDRQVKHPRTFDEPPRNQSEEEEDSGGEVAESGEESNSGDEQSKSEADTASEHSGATPEHNEGSNTDDNAEEVGEEDEDDDEDESDSESDSEEEESNERKRHSERSHSASRSPTPIRETDVSVTTDQGPSSQDAKEESSEQQQSSAPAYDIRNDLPPYLPSIYGCRNVEEFQCMNRIEEGTYGVVYRARDKKTEEIVALKRLKMEREKEGFPITSLREINTILISQHQNVVHVREIVVGSNIDKIFIVMDFVEHDMKALMETMRQKNQVFLPGEVKCLMTQLLSAVAHLHDNWILHRDLKTSNLLLSHNGILKVGDFGLAREYGSPLKPYTAIVVTLWYRAPELLLGIKEYSTFIDVWSIGCIFGEFLLMNPLFAGKSEAEQLNKIFKLLGTPNEKIWPGYNALPHVQKMKFVEFPISNFRNKFPREMLSDKGLNLLRQFLNYDPKQRISCEAALRHPYFDETPLAIDPSMFPTWPAKSEQGPHSGKKASSPKPPSGGGAFKKINADDVEARLGFQINAAIANQQPAAGWNLRF